MNTTLLRKILMAYLNSSEPTAEETDQINKTIIELNDIAQHETSDFDRWPGSLYLVHATDIRDLMLDHTYDIYRQLFIEHCGSVTYEQYAAAVQKYSWLSTTAIEFGYDMVSDWFVNNFDGSNNTSAADELERLKKFLNVCKPANADDDYELAAARTYISVLMRHTAELDRMTVND